MSQRHSEYERLENDAYYTPAWVTSALLPHIPKRIKFILEPAAGDGAIVKVLKRADFSVHARDLTKGFDFLQAIGPVAWDGVVTNPPYGKAREFIEQALELMEDNGGFIAMLLKIDYDSGVTRRHLFAEHKAFTKKIVLTQRILWIKNSEGNPSANHAWYLWDWKHKGPPTIGYAP